MNRQTLVFSMNSREGSQIIPPGVCQAGKRAVKRTRIPMQAAAEDFVRLRRLWDHEIQSLHTMKILWVSPFFLHPTDRGAQIRSLGTLRELHRRHEIHFATLDDPSNVEGRPRSSEYCTKSYVAPHRPPKRGSPAFFLQATAGHVFPDPAGHQPVSFAATRGDCVRIGRYRRIRRNGLRFPGFGSEHSRSAELGALRAQRRNHDLGTPSGTRYEPAAATLLPPAGAPHVRV